MLTSAPGVMMKTAPGVLMKTARSYYFYVKVVTFLLFIHDRTITILTMSRNKN